MAKKLTKLLQQWKVKKKSYYQHYIFQILAWTISFVPIPSSMFNCCSEEGSVAYHNKNSDWLRWGDVLSSIFVHSAKQYPKIKLSYEQPFCH